VGEVSQVKVEVVFAVASDVFLVALMASSPVAPATDEGGMCPRQLNVHRYRLWRCRW
jgi:hypothetical protein